VTVDELRKALEALPADAVVRVHYDGGARGADTAVWLAQGGHVAIGNISEPVYDDNDRIDDAVTSREDRYLEVHKMLGLPEPRDEWEET
jgi:hypothetical protein